MENNLSGSLGLNPEEKNQIFNIFEDLESEELPIGMIMFESDGSVASMCAPAELIGEEESDRITFALDFVHYAFERADWVLEFMKYNDAKKRKEAMAAHENKKAKFKLIKGGMYDDS